jgi:hypothetical protein
MIRRGERVDEPVAVAGFTIASTSAQRDEVCESTQVVRRLDVGLPACAVAVDESSPERVTSRAGRVERALSKLATSRSDEASAFWLIEACSYCHRVPRAPVGREEAR